MARSVGDRATDSLDTAIRPCLRIPHIYTMLT